MLSVLNLTASKVTDAGLEQLKGFTNLTELNLTGTRVTGSGLRHLKVSRISLSST